MIWAVLLEIFLMQLSSEMILPLHWTTKPPFANNTFNSMILVHDVIIGAWSTWWRLRDAIDVKQLFIV